MQWQKNEDLNETRPMEQKKGTSFAKLLKALQYGKPKRENLSSMASRLSRLQKKLTDQQNEEIQKLSKGMALTDFAKEMVLAIDPDRIFEQAQKEFGEKPKKADIEKTAQKRMLDALKPFIGNAKLMNRLPEIKREVEQIIDVVSTDEVVSTGHSPLAKEKARQVVGSFREFIERNKDELMALQIFYNNGKMSWKELKELADKIKAPPYSLSPSKVWRAYKQLEEKKVHGNSNDKIVDFISLLRFELEKSSELESYLDTVDKRFAEWLARQREAGVSFTQEQLNWLEKIKEHIATSVEIVPDDLESAPFTQMGGLGKAAKVFGPRFNKLLVQLNSEVGG